MTFCTTFPQRLDRDDARRDRTNTGSAFNFGDVFQSESAFNFQEFDNVVEVSDLDATADVSSKNKFGKHNTCTFLKL